MSEIDTKVLDEIDPSVVTANNMQDDKHGSPDVPSEVTISPGPGIFYWRKVLPNSVTLLATVVGLSAFRLGLDGNYQLGVLAILGAGLLDGLDGPIARALHGTSRFGAELDSLSDYVNFGVSPSLLLYFWSLHKASWYGWAISLVYTCCMGCRLARFNAGVDFNASSVTKSFFMGVPAPGGAMLVVFPLVCSFYFGDSPYFTEPIYTAPYTLFVAFMLVSRIPTFSSKMVNKTLLGKMTAIKSIGLLVVFLFVIYFIATNVWLSLIIITFSYICSFPLSYATFIYLSRNVKQD